MRIIQIAILLLPSVTAAQSLDEVLGNYLNKSGSLTKWSNVISCRQQVDMWQNLDYMYVKPGTKSVIDGQDPTSQYRIRKNPNFEFVRNTSKGVTAEFYQNDMRSGMFTYGEFFESPVENEFVTINIAINLMQLHQLKALEYLGEVKTDSTSYYVISGPYCPGSKRIIKFYFDKVTNLLKFTKDENGLEPRITRYDDYKLVQGLLVAHKVQSSANGILFFKEITKSIEFNPAIDKSVFYYTLDKPRKLIERSDVRIMNASDVDLPSFLASSFSGRRVFIDLWATWCTPCKAEFQHYDDSYYKFMRDNQIDLLFISIDKNEDIEKWKNQTHTLGLRGSHILANKLLMQSIKSLIYNSGAFQIPRYVLVNESGKIMSTDFTPPSHQSFINEITKLFQN